MNKKSNNIRRLGLAWGIIALAIWFGLGPGPAAGAQTTTVKVKTIHQITARQIIPAADGRGHFIGFFKRQGRAIFADGRKALYDNTHFVDFWRGKKAAFKGYTTFTFRDGSRIFLDWTSTVTFVPGKRPISRGRGVIVGGTGQYKGIKGTAVFSVGREQKPKAGGKPVSVANAVLTYTLP
jgi:hypothetical protein